MKVAGVATWPGVVREVAVRWGDSVRPQLPAQTLALGPVNSLAKVGAAGKNVLQAFANIVTTINKSQPNSMQFSGARGGSVSVEVKHFASTLIVELLNAAGYLTEGAAVSVRTVQALLLEDPGSSYAVAVRSQRPGNLQQGLQQGWESVLNSLKTAYDQLPNEGVIPFAKGHVTTLLTPVVLVTSPSPRCRLWSIPSCRGLRHWSFESDSGNQSELGSPYFEPNGINL